MNLRKEFEELPNINKIDILIKWFGIKPLTEEMFKDDNSYKYVTEEIIKVLKND